MSGALPQNRLGEYEILRELGRGGMGVVYLARQASLDRTVAVKVLADQYSRDDTFVKRFQREARSAARLVHANVIQIFTVGTETNVHYFAMEFVDGKDLSSRLRAGERFTQDQILDLGIQTARALQCAHEMGIVHRDIKPSNIVLDRHGTVKVMDFGLAKALSEETVQVTQPGMVMGTVNYMSPEQARGEGIDSRSDLYSLGVVLFELLTGRVPFRSETPTAAIYMHLHEPPPRPRDLNPEIPPHVETVVLRLLAKDPAARYATPRELIDDLERVRRGEEPVQGGHTMELGTPSGGRPAAALDATMDLTPAKPRDARTLVQPKAPVPPAGGGARKIAIAAAVVLAAGGASGAGYLALRNPPSPPPPHDVPAGPREVDLAALLRPYEEDGEFRVFLDNEEATGPRGTRSLPRGARSLILRRDGWTPLVATLHIPEADAQPARVEIISLWSRRGGTNDPAPNPPPRLPSPEDRVVDLAALLRDHDPDGRYELTLDERIESRPRTGIRLAPKRYDLALKRPFWTPLTATLLVPPQGEPTLEGLAPWRRDDALIEQEVRNRLNATGAIADDVERFAVTHYPGEPLPEPVRHALALSRAVATARTLSAAGRWEEILEVLRTYAADPQADDLIERARREIERQRHTQSQERDAAVTRARAELDAFGQAMHKGQYDLARGALERLQPLAGSHHLDDALRGEISGATARLEEATRAWDEAQQARNASRWTEAYDRVARVLALSSDFPPALQLQQEAREALRSQELDEQQERSRRAALQGAREALDGGDLPGAEAALRTVESLRPDDPDAAPLRTEWMQRTLVARLDRALRDRDRTEYLACIDLDSEFGRAESARIGSLLAEGGPARLEHGTLALVSLDVAGGRARINWQAAVAVAGKSVTIQRLMEARITVQGTRCVLTGCTVAGGP